MKIGLVKLITGEEVIGQWEEHRLGDGTLRHDVKKPITVLTLPPKAQGQQPGITFLPFIPYVRFENDTVEFAEAHVIFAAEVDIGLEDAYRKVAKLPPRILTEKDRGGLILPT
jgi:hypothetical protein